MRVGVRGALTVLLLLSAWPGAASGQWFDAQMPRAGELQFGLSGRSSSQDERFRPDGTTESLAEVFALELDARLVPPLDTLDARLDALFSDLGLDSPGTSTLGRVRHDALLERTELPFTFVMGLSDWLAAFAVLPIVRGKSFTETLVDSASAAAGPSGTAFGGDPNAFLSELDGAIAELESMVDADTLSAQRRAEAEALLSEARTLETGLAELADLEFLPTAAGTAGSALLTFYDGLQVDFQDFGLELPALGLADPVDAGRAAELSSGPEFGIEAPENRDTGFRLGDIELGVSLQPLNTFRGRSDERPLAVRTRLDVLWRAATGDEPAANRITDVGTGDGGSDLEFRSTLDLALGSRVWLSLFGGYNMQLETDLVRLITDPEAPIQPGAFTTPVRIDPGDVMTLTVAPRFNFTREITFSIAYTYRDRGRDRVQALSPETGAFSVPIIEQGSGYTLQRFGFAVRYASTSWTGDARPSIPAEVELRYRTTVAASDGLAPATNTWTVAVRIYKGVMRDE